MGSLFESLPGVIFFIYLLAKILHGLNKEIEEEPNRETNEERKREIEKDKQRDLSKPKKIEPKIEPQIEIEIEEEFSGKPTAKKQLREAEFKKQRRDNSKVKLSEQKKKPKRKQVLDGEITRDDILRGVIFKEVLDQPRALRKYRPPYRSEQ
ncbi:hypothetical protein MWH25_01665 [Natroniella acetigena]|uniref:hypothetical protein n=1 Tax=Natroniella acetigena TaxID=52004 RepID=UPI00200A25F6|nr:hypothetical protein [Natroniella acetigena]MCK8826456.1 hypothetical protein [Natroniella acetigena]